MTSRQSRSRASCQTALSAEPPASSCLTCRESGKTSFSNVRQSFRQLLVEKQSHALGRRNAQGSALAFSRVGQACPDVIACELWEVGQELVLRHPTGQVAKDIAYRDPSPTNTWFAKPDPGIGADTIEEIHKLSLQQLAVVRQNVPLPAQHLYQRRATRVVENKASARPVDCEEETRFLSLPKMGMPMPNEGIITHHHQRSPQTARAPTISPFAKAARLGTSDLRLFLTWAQGT